MASPDYVYKLIDRDTLDPLTILANADDRKVTLELNRQGSAVFSLPVDDPVFDDYPDLTGMTAYAIAVERAGQRIFAGELVSAEADISDDDPRITFTANGWLHHLNSRLTPKPLRYEQIDQAEIAWDLIDSTQKGWALKTTNTSGFAGIGKQGGGVDLSTLIDTSSTKFTIGGWFKIKDPTASSGFTPPGSGAGEYRERLISLGGWSGANYRYTFDLCRVANTNNGFLADPGDHFEFLMNQGNSNTAYNVKTRPWYTTAMVYGSGDIFVAAAFDLVAGKMIINAFYFDGTPFNEYLGGADGAWSVTGIPNAVFTTPDTLRLGSDFRIEGANLFNGTMDDVFVLNEYCDYNTMQQIARGDINVFDRSSKGYWRFDSGTDAYTFDSSNAATANHDLSLYGDFSYTKGIKGNVAEYDYGFTEGDVPSGVPRDDTYENKNIAEAIQQKAALEGGFDFEITPDKVFNAYYPQRGSIKEDLIFEWGRNIDNVKIDYSNEELANEVVAVGEGTTAGSSDDSTLATHAIDHQIMEAQKLRQAIDSFKDVSRIGTLTGHAAEALRLSTGTKKIFTFDLVPEIAPAFGEYDLGDYCVLLVNSGGIQEATYFRIYTIELAPDQEGLEKVSLTIANL